MKNYKCNCGKKCESIINHFYCDSKGKKFNEVLYYCEKCKKNFIKKYKLEFMYK